MFSMTRTRSISERAVQGKVSSPLMLAALLVLCGVLLGLGSIQAFAAGAAKADLMGQADQVSPASVPCFGVVDSANTSNNYNSLSAVEALSPNDVWAVGDEGSSAGAKQMLVEHWNGTAWSIVPVAPPAGATNSYLAALSALSVNDIWAAGYYFIPRSGMLTLTLHWDGSTWSQVPSVSVSGYNSYLNSVAAIAHNDVWAVGYADYGPGPIRTLVIHWDGIQWAEVTDTDPRTSERVLNGVTATSPNDVWAVGYYYDFTSAYQTFVERWNGTTWSVVPSPNQGVNNYLYAVSASGPNDVWAVGKREIRANTSNPIMLHWNGTQWSYSTIPYVGSNPGELRSVRALGPYEVYAAGYWATFQGLSNPYVIHWNGSVWTMTSTETPGYRYNFINGVAALAGGDTWIVGDYYNASMVVRTLIEHNNCGAPTPLLVGHVTWQGRPNQPDPRQQMPLSLTLKLGQSEMNYIGMTTDASGFFTVSLPANAPSGLYDWTAKGPQYLANVGQVNLDGGPSTQVELGLMRGGDANNDGMVNVSDFVIVKASFGKSVGQLGYDARADFTGDDTVNASDFNILKVNFGGGYASLHK